MEGRGYEKLVALYLRLNGYFIVDNFILHRERSGQMTEVDVFGVRFPHQVEKLGETEMLNDPKLVDPDQDWVDVVFAEVKSGSPKVNEPWHQQGVLEYILRFVGFTDKEAKVSEVAECLRTRYHAEYGDFRFRIVAFGQGDALHESEEGLQTIPPIPLQHTLDFVRKRFYRFKRQKADISQWDNATLQGYLLRELRQGKRLSLKGIERWGQKMMECSSVILDDVMKRGEV